MNYGWNDIVFICFRILIYMDSGKKKKDIIVTIHFTKMKL